jgi:hypothetical protein
MGHLRQKRAPRHTDFLNEREIQAKVPEFRAFLYLLSM